MRHFAILAVAIFLSVNANSQESHCSENEDILFSCAHNTKIVSLCASKNVSESSGYIQYRFGKRNNIELAHPKAMKNPKDSFTAKNTYYSDTTESSVEFSIGKYIYTIYNRFVTGSTDEMNNDTTGIYGEHAGVIVTRSNNVVSEIQCDHGTFTYTFNQLPKFLYAK